MEHGSMSMEALNHLKTEFELFGKNGASKSPEWVQDVRKEAFSFFLRSGFPTTQQEDWKYTNVTPIAKSAFKYSSVPNKISPEALNKYLVEGEDNHVMTFVDGHFSKEHSNLDSLPKEVILKNLSLSYGSNDDVVKNHLTKYAKHENNPFTALNTAFINDGAFLHVPENIVVEKPIHIIFLSTRTKEQTVSHIRNLIVVEENANVCLLTGYYSLEENKNFTNVVTEIVAKKKSIIELVKVQQESTTSFHIENIHSHQHGSSSVKIFSLALGASISRNDMSTIIDGELAEGNLNGLYIASGDQLVDHHTYIHHIHPNCPSHELFKGILTDNGRAVFNGKVYVEPEAQKTDSKQTNRNLLLSDTAIVDTKPELEIFADDVKCTHGATVGGMNQSHQFYLKSRGISEEATRTILTVGFAAEATGKIDNESIRHHVDVLVVDHLKSILHNTNVPEIIHG